MQIRGRDETCQMSEKSFFFTRKITRDERPHRLQLRARNSFVGPPVPTARAPEAVRRRRRRPRRARAKSRAPRFRTRIRNGAASETSSTALAAPSTSSASSPKRRAPSRTPRAPPARTPRPRRPPAGRRTRPRRARAPRLGGVSSFASFASTRRGARGGIDDLSSPPSLLSPRVGFARGRRFEPRPEGRMRRVRMRRCHVSPPHERVHHRVRARRGRDAATPSYASKSAFAGHQDAIASPTRRRRSSPRARRRCLKCSRSSLRHPRRHARRGTLARPRSPRGPRGPRSPERSGRSTRAALKAFGVREARAPRASRRRTEKRIIRARRRPRRHGEKARPAERTVRNPSEGEGHLVAHAPAAVARRASREGGTRPYTCVRGGGGGRSRVSARLVRRRRRTFGKRAEKPGRRVGCRGGGRPRTRRVPPCVPRPSRARSRRWREREARRAHGRGPSSRSLRGACGADRRPPGMTRHVSSQGFFRVWNLESFQSRERNEQPCVSNRRKRGSNNQGSIRTT